MLDITSNVPQFKRQDSWFSLTTAPAGNEGSVAEPSRAEFDYVITLRDEIARSEAGYFAVEQ